MSESNGKGPDHTVLATNVEVIDEEPRIYAVADLRPYIKPEMDEELGAPQGTAPANCGTEILCSCVPVETCVCDTVSYRGGGSTCPSDCACQCTSTCTCQCTGTCVSHYWYPN